MEEGTMSPNSSFEDRTIQSNVSAKKNRIVVPQRPINGGFDFKFQTDPHDVNLYQMMSADEFTDAITRLNDSLRPSRSTKLDGVLLVAGPLMVPLALWGVRHSRQVKKRKKLFRSAVDEFNSSYPELYMRWNKRMGGSILTIEQRDEEKHGSAPMNYNVTSTNVNNGNKAALVVYSEHSQTSSDFLT